MHSNDAKSALRHPKTTVTQLCALKLMELEKHSKTVRHGLFMKEFDQ